MPFELPRPIGNERGDGDLVPRYTRRTDDAERILRALDDAL